MALAFTLLAILNRQKNGQSVPQKNRGGNKPLVSSFNVEEKQMNSLNILLSKIPDKDWLKYISENRTGKAKEEGYDVIIGSVANDQVIRTVNNYLKGYFLEDIATQLLLPQKLKNQYTFKTKNYSRF